MVRRTGKGRPAIKPGDSVSRVRKFNPGVPLEQLEMFDTSFRTGKRVTKGERTFDGNSGVFRATRAPPPKVSNLPSGKRLPRFAKATASADSRKIEQEIPDRKTPAKPRQPFPTSSSVEEKSDTPRLRPQSAQLPIPTAAAKQEADVPQGVPAVPKPPAQENVRRPASVAAGVPPVGSPVHRMNPHELRRYKQLLKASTSWAVEAEGDAAIHAMQVEHDRLRKKCKTAEQRARYATQINEKASLALEAKAQREHDLHEMKRIQAQVVEDYATQATQHRSSQRQRAAEKAAIVAEMEADRKQAEKLAREERTAVDALVTRDLKAAEDLKKQQKLEKIKHEQAEMKRNLEEQAARRKAESQHALQADTEMEAHASRMHSRRQHDMQRIVDNRAAIEKRAASVMKFLPPSLGELSERQSQRSAVELRRITSTFDDRTQREQQQRLDAKKNFKQAMEEQMNEKTAKRNAERAAENEWAESMIQQDVSAARKQYETKARDAYRKRVHYADDLEEQMRTATEKYLRGDE